MYGNNQRIVSQSVGPSTSSFKREAKSAPQPGGANPPRLNSVAAPPQAAPPLLGYASAGIFNNPGHSSNLQHAANSGSSYTGDNYQAAIANLNYENSGVTPPHAGCSSHSLSNMTASLNANSHLNRASGAISHASGSGVAGRQSAFSNNAQIRQANDKISGAIANSKGNR